MVLVKIIAGLSFLITIIASVAYFVYDYEIFSYTTLLVLLLLAEFELMTWEVKK